MILRQTYKACKINKLYYIKMKRDVFSRRAFLTKGGIGGLGLFTIGSAMACSRSTDKSGTIESGRGKIENIGGISLEQLRDQYRSELYDYFIPNMDKYAVDHKYGGVICSLDIRTGEPENMNKTAWFVGRGLWVYSYLYNNLEPDSRFLEIARKSKDLLLKLQPKDDSFWPETFSREGKPLSGPGDIYGSLFVAEGLSEYAEASGEKEYRDLAKKIIFDCVARYDQPDYSYSIGSYLKNSPPVQGPRILGHWMILLSLSTQMLMHEPDEDLEKLAARCVDAILNHHVNAEYGLTNEVLNHDFSLPDNEYAQHSITGHGLETLAFVMFEAGRLRDRNLFRSAEKVFKKIVDVCADHVYGGYFHTLQQVDNYIWSTGKSLWCQQEVINGALFLIEHTGDEWAMRHFERANSHIFEKYFNPAHKFWHFGGDRKMVNRNVSLMEHYHHARQFVRGLLTFERLIERGGRISDLFA
mgnify:FL=1